MIRVGPGTVRLALAASGLAASVGLVAAATLGPATGLAATDPPSATVCGDVDLDDSVSPSDVEILRMFFAGLDTGGLDLESGPSVERCDVDSSETCDLVDLTSILRFLAGAPGADLRDCANLVLPPGVVADSGPFDLSGTLAISAGHFVDSDVNDTTTTPVPNDSPAQAQPLPSIARVGGYLNEPNAGPAGNSFASGDLLDQFRVTLEAGQVITLEGDSARADLDLYLFESPTLQFVDASLSPTSVERLVIRQAGSYLISVTAFGGASGYVLTLGREPGSVGERESDLLYALRMSDDFVPGEVVGWPAGERNPAPLRADESAALTSARLMGDRLGMRVLAGSPSTGMLFALGSSAGSAERAFVAMGMDDARSRLYTLLPPIDSEQKRRLDTLLAVKAMRGRSDMESADPNYIQQAARTPNDPFFPFQAHYRVINAPAAWDITVGSAAVVVGVIDTGIRANHPDLAGQLVAGFDFISDPTRARDGDGIDPNPDDPGDLAFDMRSSFHGTHVAGTIGARTNNGVGVSGLAWNVSIMPLRTLGIDGGTSFDSQQAILYAARLPNVSNTLPPVRADILNLSLGGPVPSLTGQSTYTRAREAGVIVIAAAGNDSSGLPFFPASYDGVVSVSAVDLQGKATDYSNFGSGIDVSAPGGDLTIDSDGDSFPDGILSTLVDDSGATPSNTYNFLQGTSFAAPHVAGVAALMKSIDPGLTPDDFDRLLLTGGLSVDRGELGRDDVFGVGVIDARRAVETAGGALPASSPFLSVAPRALGFGFFETALSLDVTNSGTGSLAVLSISDDSNGLLTVTPTAVDASGLGRYTITLDRSAMSPGRALANITIVTTLGAVSVPVSAELLGGGGELTPNAGTHVVSLIDLDTQAVVARGVSVAAQGVYTFELTDVPEGRYRLTAGSDLDNDGSVCGPHEACGAFPTLAQPGEIIVDRDLSGLDFPTGFRIGITPMAPAESLARPTTPTSEQSFP